MSEMFKDDIKDRMQRLDERVNLEHGTDEREVKVNMLSDMGYLNFLGSYETFERRFRRCES